MQIKRNKRGGEKTKPIGQRPPAPPSPPVLDRNAEVTVFHVQAAAAAIANERGMRRGAPPITGILQMLPEKLRAEVIDDAKAALEAAVAAGLELKPTGGGANAMGRT